jgi:hypothetical protein
MIKKNLHRLASTQRDYIPSQYIYIYIFVYTVKPVLSGHSWGMSKVTSQERWPLRRGSVKTDQSCHQMDCQALSRNPFCTCIYGCKWT